MSPCDRGWFGCLRRQLYMRQVLNEIARLRRLNLEGGHVKACLVSAVKFAFRVHQFVRGFNEVRCTPPPSEPPPRTSTLQTRAPDGGRLG
eukprot:6894809-Pyramimonas_sp.AAC.1